MALFRRRPLRLRTKHAKRSMLLAILYRSVLLCVIGGLFFGVWTVTRLPMFTIHTVTVDGGPTVSAEIIREAIDAELEGNYFFIVPKRFTYTYPYKKIVERVSAIPRIAHAEVVRTSKNTLQVTFEEHEPYALWCTGGYTACVFLSESGYAFATAPSLKGNTFIRYVIEGREPTPGTQIFEETELRAIELFMSGLRTEFSFRVYEVTLTPEDDVVYHLEKGSSILVARTMAVQEAFDNLHSVLESEAFVDLVPGQFDYIDLRFGNRVFVKEEFTAPSGDEATSTPESE